jgi:peptidoglycan/LPS O-acetylase OafA/YrhL
MEMNFKKYIQITMVILVVISIVIIALGVMKWSERPYTGLIYLIIGVIQFLGGVLLFPRIAKREDMQEVGNLSVQANWLVLSIGIAGMALFMAPFFRLESMVVPYIAFILCIVSVILSGLNIFTAVKKAKARMIV